MALRKNFNIKKYPVVRNELISMDSTLVSLKENLKSLSETYELLITSKNSHADCTDILL